MSGAARLDVLHFREVEVPVHGGSTAGPWSFSVGWGQVAAVAAAPSVADTVARLVAGVVAPLAGQVEVLGLVPTRLGRYDLLALRRRLGVAFQREGLVSNLSLRENLVLPLVYGGRLRRGEARAWVDRALTTLGLAGQAGLRPADLTREARITGAVARAALHGPELLVVEHLLAGLPPDETGALVGWCRERCGSILLLAPGPDEALGAAVDGWLDPLTAPAASTK